MKKPSSGPLIALLTLAALLGPCGRLSGEDAGTPRPFVSRIKVEVAEGRVTLTWKDTEVIQEGTNLVYRHKEPITDSNFTKAVLLTRVAFGRGSFVDDPPDDGGYYYAVVVEDKQGKGYPFFIPFRNSTVTVASIRAPTAAPQAAGSTGAVIQETAASAASPAAPMEGAAGTPAAEQAAASEPGPLVSALAAVVDDWRIRLTWKDPADVSDGAAVVYRSLQPIDSVPPRQAEALDRLPAGREAYEDIPPDEQPYFYAVLWERQGKRTNPGIYPGRNRTAAASAVLARATEEKMASRITGIRTELSADGQAVIVSFQSSNPRRELLLFWSTSAIRTEEDLTRSATPIPLEPGTLKYQVYTIPGSDSWFAVLDSGLFKVGKSNLVSGENSSVKPVAVTLRLAEGQMVRRRTLPLPELRLNAAIGTGPETNLPPALRAPSRVPVSSATAKALASILSTVSEQAAVEMRPMVLPGDRSPGTAGELQPLVPIALGPLMQGKTAEAEQKLRDFLGVHRGPEAEAHARYYLGQALYFQGRFREAFLEFLSAQDALYAPIQPWMDACYRKLADMGTGPS